MSAYTAVPYSLKDIPHWVVWKYETRDGKETKVPYDAKTAGARAKSNDSSTWATFNKVLDTLQDFHNDYDGIGFMLHGTDLVGVDFDGVIQDGKVEPFVLDILEKLGKPYSEITPSGNGLRAFVRCAALPGDQRKFTGGNKYGAEIYSGSEGGRYLTATGNHFSGTGVPTISDISLPYFMISQIRNEKLKKLWMGDTTHYDGDDSRADLALCGMLASLLNNDSKKIEVTFNASKLGQREKWIERKDYRERTIKQAIKPTAHLSSNERGDETGQFHCTELGNANRLVARFGEDIRHNHEQHKWYEWTGSVWTRDRKGSMKKRMEEVVRDILKDAADAQDSDTRKYLMKWAMRSEAEHVSKGALNWATSKVPVLTEEFDRDIYLFNLNNGTLDLRTGEFCSHRKEDLLTKITPVDYDPAAKCPRWEQFLTEVMDEDTVPFLQRAIGYSLTGFTGEHCLFLLYGLGRNGKSVFLTTIQHVLGDYSMQTNWQSFTVAKNGGIQIRNDIAKLHGARFVAAIESEKNVRVAESLIKTLTGGDRIAARFLYQEEFEFQPQFKLWLATNHKPKIIGTDEAIWSRIKLIPFDVTIPAEKCDVHLTDKLKAEASGILNWALEGLNMYRQDGLKESVTVSSATADYRRDSDVIQHFMDAQCTTFKDARVRTSELYLAYKAWTEATGEFQMNERDFGTALEERGIKRGRTKDERLWHGVNLKGGITLPQAATELEETLSF